MSPAESSVCRNDDHSFQSFSSRKYRREKESAEIRAEMNIKSNQRRGDFSFKEGSFSSPFISRSSSNSSNGKRYSPAKVNTRFKFKSVSRSRSKSSSKYGYRSESMSLSDSRSRSRSNQRRRSKQGHNRISKERGRSKERVRRSYESSPGEYLDNYYCSQDEDSPSRLRSYETRSRRFQNSRSVSSSVDRSSYKGRTYQRSDLSYLKNNPKNQFNFEISKITDREHSLKNITTSYSKSLPGSRSTSRSRNRSRSVEKNRSGSRTRGRNRSRDKIRYRDRGWSRSRSKSKSKSRSRSASVTRSKPLSKQKYISRSQSKPKSKSKLRSRSRSGSSLDEISVSNSISKSARHRSEYYRNEDSYEQDYDHDHEYGKNTSGYNYSSGYLNRQSHAYSYGHSNSYYNDYDKGGYNYGDRNWKNYQNSRYSNKYRDRNESYAQRSFSEERERSRERERRRRRMQAECIKKAGGFQKLAQSEGKEPTPVFYDGFQWVAKTGSTASMDPATMNNTRRFRRLYFGNLPLNLGLTESNFQQIVWQEMALRGLCLNPNENPILCVWFAQKKGNYGFIEFRTVEETEKALQLDGFACMGSKIKVSRPNDYSQALLSSSGSTQTPCLSLFNPNNMLNYHPIIAGTITKDNAMALGQQAALQLLFSIEDTYPLGTLNLDSKVIRISNVLDHSLIQDPDQCQKIKQDFCSGIEYKDSILSSKIITIDDISRLCQELAERDIQLEPADILLEFDSSSSLQLSVSAMSIAKYDHKIPKMNFFDENFYHSHLKR
ncbi:splicing factor U2AF like auxilary factor [Cryptosporidium ubiquitum]|uniref:Splicing factor U2AF like auxilary factor n=1 Tax=Cryptosporidium ubiquitum TaxID=857276 RepID=A0A1J4MKM6_9CRYT|nr:splicing factor U2AF like auxilary factor [Cryptosporidium ubiquitum]OII74750.1 splicing factor U2AF like auxilary factor [Cryptosporidium ubiquitum]